MLRVDFDFIDISTNRVRIAQSDDFSDYVLRVLDLHSLTCLQCHKLNPPARIICPNGQKPLVSERLHARP
jgi:hypothetical protein